MASKAPIITAHPSDLGAALGHPAVAGVPFVLIIAAKLPATRSVFTLTPRSAERNGGALGGQGALPPEASFRGEEDWITSGASESKESAVSRRLQAIGWPTIPTGEGGRGRSAEARTFQSASARRPGGRLQKLRDIPGPDAAGPSDATLPQPPHLPPETTDLPFPGP